MSKDDVIETEGKVVEALPNATFKVQLSNGHIITATLAEPSVSARSAPRLTSLSK